MAKTLQASVRLRTTLGKADAATFEERADDARLVVEEVTRYVFFIALLEERHCKIDQDTALKRILYGPHEEIVKELNKRQISVYTLACAVHCIMTHLNVYNKKTVAEKEVNMFSTATFDGARAMQEIVLWLLTLGQNCDEADYSRSGSTWVFNGNVQKCVIEVPGIAASQLDPRNQEALRFAHSYVTSLKHGDRAVHDRGLTADGLFGDKATYFLRSPLFLGEWPQPYEPDVVIS